MVLSVVYQKETGNSLRKVGNELMGLCPFHDDKTPSFSINDEKKVFNCFTCGNSGSKGNIYHFLMKLRGFSFTDCVQYLKDAYNYIDEDLKFHYSLSKLKEPRSEGCKVWYSSRANKDDIYFLNKNDLEKLEGDIFSSVASYVKNTRQPIGDEFALLVEYDAMGLPVNCCIRGVEGGSYYKIPDLSGRRIYGASSLKSSWCFVVEGISDASALHKFGLPAVAMQGLNANTLRGLNVRRLVFWVDGDKAGRSFLEKFYKLDDFDFIVDVVWTEDYDVNDFVKKILSQATVEEIKKKPFSYLPKSKPYLEWLSENYLVDVSERRYIVEEILFKKRNLYDATRITVEWCKKNGVDFFGFFCFLEKSVRISRQLELYLLGSKKYKNLPADFFFYKDIQVAYNVMIFEGEEKALAEFPEKFVEVPEGFDPEKCFNELNKKRFLREGIKILHAILEGRKSLRDLKDLQSLSVENKDITSLIVKEGFERSIAKLGEGFSEIDNELEVFLGGSLTLFGARTGHGKTMFCLNIVKNLLNKGVAVRYYCMEMKAVEMTTRLLAMKEGVSYDKIKENFPHYFNENKSARPNSNEKKFLNYFTYCETLSLDDITNKIEPNSIVFVDYIQSVTSSAYKVKGMQNFEFLKIISRQLKAIALERKAAIFCVVQMADNFEIENSLHYSTYQGFITGAKAITQDADLFLTFGMVDGALANRQLRVNKSRHTKLKKEAYQICFDEENLRMTLLNENLKKQGIAGEEKKDFREEVFPNGKMV